MTEILALIDLGLRDEAAAALRERIASRQDEHGGHAEEARLAEPNGGKRGQRPHEMRAAPAIGSSRATWPSRWPTWSARGPT